MSETQVQVNENTDDVPVRRGRGRPANPNKVAVIKTPKVSKVKETVQDDDDVVEPLVDISFVIDDFADLRNAAQNAMGEYASKVDADIVNVLQKQKKGPGHRFYVHPLSLHVLTGSDRINSRNFDNYSKRERIVTFGKTLLNGIETPVEVFVQNDKLCVFDGETRLRATLHNYIRAANGEEGFEHLLNPETSPLALIPIIIGKGGNDRDRILRIAAKADQMPFTPIETAHNIGMAYNLGEKQGMTRMDNLESIAKSYGRTTAFVINHLQMLELPSEVIGLLKREPIAVHMAMKAWKVTKENPTKTLEILEEAVAESKAAAGGKPYKVMPKHAPKLRVVVDNDNSGDDSDKAVSQPKSEKASKPSSSAVDKATDFIVNMLHDMKWKVEDGFVSIDTSPSSPAFQFTCEEFMKYAKALSLRIPDDLEGLDDEEEG